MTRSAKDITDAELAIMQELWQAGVATTRHLTERLYPEATVSAHATVQKLLERLEGKQCVSRNRDVWPHRFSPAIQKDDLISLRLKNTASQLCEGDLHPLLSCLVRNGSLSASDRQSLRNLLDELDQDGPGKTAGRDSAEGKRSSREDVE